jgi:signal transduction histidine kinase
VSARGLEAKSTWRIHQAIRSVTFERSVIALTLVLLGVRFAFAGLGPLGGLASGLDIAFWVGLIGVVELLHVQVWKSIQVSMGLPLLMATAFIYRPEIAALIGFLSSSDPREWRREVTLSRALFNRSQVGLSVLAASAIFHLFNGGVHTLSGALRGAPAAVLVDFLVNTTLVSVLVSLVQGTSVREVRRKLRIGSAQEFLVSYMGLGLLGVLLARLFVDQGWWAVAVFVLPLLLARQMFFRTRALEDATQELRDREVVLRGLSNRMAEERQDERMQIAGYLHDDLAQILYRMSLQIDIAERKLERGDKDAEKELEGLRATKDRALTVIRALIKDLHRSPLGRAGLEEALRSYCQDVEKDTGMRVQSRLQHVDMPPPIQLLCYHIAREAVMNAVKHAEPATIRVHLEPTTDGARLTVSDDGKGFDPDQGSPEGHYGLTMMRERAQVAGGTFEMDSRPGQGTIVTAEFPTSWFVQEDRSTDGDGTEAPTQEEASARDARA